MVILITRKNWEKLAVQTSRAAKGLPSKKESGLSSFNSSQESGNGRGIIITQTF